MQKSFYKLVVIISVVSIMFACVPARKFEDEKTRRENCEKQNAELKKTGDLQLANIKELSNSNEEFNKRNKNLMKDTMVLGTSLRTMQSQYDKINLLNNELIDKLEKIKTGNLEETKKILSELQGTKEDLIKKETDLKRLEKILNDRETNLDRLTEELKSSQRDLEIKQKKLEELQTILYKKDSVVSALKATVSDALLGFENKGLSIQQKNGKVYVSMEEALLFPSGSFAINKRGQEALKKLSMVLDVNNDINVLVEGHTDNVPYNGSGQLKDNWDLSVMRATAIVKALLQGSKIDPLRLTAAGRGEYFPIDSNKTSEGRAKNRRTEVILTPKLDELFKIIETN